MTKKREGIRARSSNVTDDESSQQTRGSPTDPGQSGNTGLMANSLLHHGVCSRVLVHNGVDDGIKHRALGKEG